MIAGWERVWCDSTSVYPCSVLPRFPSPKPVFSFLTIAYYFHAGRDDASRQTTERYRNVQDSVRQVQPHRLSVGHRRQDSRLQLHHQNSEAIVVPANLLYRTHSPRLRRGFAGIEKKKTEDIL